VITSDELKRVTARLISRDKRTIGDVEAMDWQDSAEDGDWTYGTAMRAVRELLRNPDGPYITPAHVDQVIRKQRRTAAESFIEPHQPEGMPNGQYLALCRRAKARHVESLLERWAQTGTMPKNAIETGAIPRTMLTQGRRMIEGPAAEAPVSTTRGASGVTGPKAERDRMRRASRDPQTFAQAIAELKRTTLLSDPAQHQGESDVMAEEGAA
jgi:hypothetical protein